MYEGIQTIPGGTIVLTTFMEMQRKVTPKNLGHFSDSNPTMTFWIQVRHLVHTHITQTHILTHIPIQTQKTHQEQIPMKTTSTTATTVITTMMVMYTTGKATPVGEGETVGEGEGETVREGEREEWIGRRGRKGGSWIPMHVSYHRISLPANDIY